MLICKRKPEWQKGLLNGVGGKIEEGEYCNVAMSREFEEETGVKTAYTDWKKFTEMHMPDEVVVYCFVTRLPRDNDRVRSTTEELVMWHDVDRISAPIIPNLRWLIPMALHALNNEDNRYVPHTLNYE